MIRYQLVLQLPFRETADLDHLVAYEDMLLRSLPRRFGRVDGHDAGSGQMNIFILTNHPERAFPTCRDLIRSSRLALGIRAAYRERDGENYVWLCPPNSLEPFVVL